MEFDRGLARSLVYGSAVGDALGVPFEFKSRGSFTCTGMVGYGTHNQPAGTWSDDTSLLLATMDSITKTHRVDVKDMRGRFVAWLRMGKYACGGDVFDVGMATYQALTQGVGMDGERSNGNGSLMRILPLALIDATDDEVRAVSAITHAHAISMDACVDLVHFARGLIAGDPKWPTIPTSRDEVRSGGFVLDTLSAALWCLATTDSYTSCVLTAVNLGDDTDTTACVAGGLAGLYYGFAAIPQDWIDTLRDKSLIDDIIG